MRRARAEIDREPPAQCIEAVRHAREPCLGQGERVDHARCGQRGPADAAELRIEEREIERRIVRDQIVVAEEFQQFVDNLAETRLAGEVCQGEAVNPRGVLRNVALGVDQSVEMPSGRQVVQQFQRGHLDHPVAELRFQTGGFRVEQDGAAH